MKNWFCWIPYHFAETIILESLVGVLSPSANRHNQMHKVSWEHWAVIGCNLFAYLSKYWTLLLGYIWTLGFKRLYARHLLQIQLLSYFICSVKAEFGKIFTVSFPTVFVTVLCGIEFYASLSVPVLMILCSGFKNLTPGRPQGRPWPTPWPTPRFVYTPDSASVE